MSSAEPVERPVLHVVRGTPDDLELAALVAVVSAAAVGPADPVPVTRSAWCDPRRSVRSSLPAGGWRASSSPR